MPAALAPFDARKIATQSAKFLLLFVQLFGRRMDDLELGLGIFIGHCNYSFVHKRQV